MSKDEFSSRVTSAEVPEAEPLEQRCSSTSNSRVPVQGEIGFVGLGHMGTAMAANLAAAGRRVIAYVRRPEQMGKLVALGLKPTTDISGLFHCEIVISKIARQSYAPGFVMPLVLKDVRLALAEAENAGAPMPSV